MSDRCAGCDKKLFDNKSWFKKGEEEISLCRDKRITNYNTPKKSCLEKALDKIVLVEPTGDRAGFPW